MLIGVAAVILGGFFIICAAPFASHRLYKAGGGFFLVSGEFTVLMKHLFKHKSKNKIVKTTCLSFPVKITRQFQ